MEVLIKLPNEVVHGDVIKADRGRIRPDASPLVVSFRERRACLHVGKIYGVYAGSDGLYAVYSVSDVGELVRIADAVAPKPAGGLKPIAAKVRNFVYAVCDGEKFDEMIDDDCQPVYELLEVPQRELPGDLITRENLRDVLLSRLDLRMALYYDALRYIAPTVLKLVPLCDEDGEVSLSKYDYVYYCRIGERTFVKRRLDEPFYEVPGEWLQGLEVRERAVHPGVEELRKLFGLEVDARQLISHVAQSLGLAEAQRYVHRKYCAAPDMELPENRRLETELYGGIVKVFKAHRLYYGDYDCVDAPSPYGVYVVICTTLQQHKCEAWRIGEVGPDEPPDVVADCVEKCECAHELLDRMPAEKREEVLKIVEERLRDGLERGLEFDRVRCYPLETLSRVLGPVASYEEAEAKWRQTAGEIERKREEERRRLEKEKRRRREEKKREVLDKVKKLGLPLKVDVRDYAIYVTFARHLPNDKFQAAVKALKELGFKFDWKDKAWYCEL